MNPVIALLALTTSFNGLLMNLTVDAALTMVPMHWRTNSVVSTPITHCNNLGSWVVVFPLLWIRAALITVLASVLSSAEHSSRRELLHIVYFSREHVV
jgi:hypothetical protein